MPKTRAAVESIASLLDASRRPIYAVSRERRIVYANRALAQWLELDTSRIVGRRVEYHSEPTQQGAAHGEATAPLTDLCPPPRALAGAACTGTVSSAARGGGLVHRRAEFVPLISTHGDDAPGGVLALLAAQDFSPQELADEISGEPLADELHRVIRRFRRSQAERYSLEALLGDSSAMRKIRAQVAAAAASGANALICGLRGTGRGQVARAIHYTAVGDRPVKLVPVDCRLVHDDLLRRALDAVGGSNADARNKPTLLLEHLDQLSTPHQSELLAAMQHSTFPACVIATCSRHRPSTVAAAESTREEAAAPLLPISPSTPPAASTDIPLLPGVIDAISTIRIEVPRLVDRLADLPVLAQYFLECANRGSEKQVGSVRTDALDLLALHSWPGELDELREVIAAAHRACTSHEITAGDLPPVVHHAAQAATHIRRPPERIVLDELLAKIEREAIERALARAHGNKTEAAELLGMTRPRLYRRLVQLGLAGPVFIEDEAADEAS